MLTRVSQAITITFFLYLITGMNSIAPIAPSSTTANQQSGGIKLLPTAAGTIKPKL